MNKNNASSNNSPKNNAINSTVYFRMLREALNELKTSSTHVLHSKISGICNLAELCEKCVQEEMNKSQEEVKSK